VNFRIVLALLVLLVGLVSDGWAQKLPRDFVRFLALVDAAQAELQNGNATGYKALWSQSDDVTLSGGFGGKIEKGWVDVSGRLDWAASQFKNGSNTIERISTVVRGDLGYLVQMEHIKFTNPAGERVTNDLRVTMVFRKERKTWRIEHRHADGQTTKVPA